MKSVIFYTFLRLVILLSFLAVGYLVGLRGLTLIVISFLLSGIISLFVLNKSRDQFSKSIYNLGKKINKRIDAAAEKEDKFLDTDFVRNINLTGSVIVRSGTLDTGSLKLLNLNSNLFTSSSNLHLIISFLNALLL